MGKVWELLTPLGEHVEFVYEVEVEYGNDPKTERARLNGTLPR